MVELAGMAEEEGPVAGGLEVEGVELGTGPTGKTAAAPDTWEVSAAHGRGGEGMADATQPPPPPPLQAMGQVWTLDGHQRASNALLSRRLSLASRSSLAPLSLSSLAPLSLPALAVGARTSHAKLLVHCQVVGILERNPRPFVVVGRALPSGSQSKGSQSKGGKQATGGKKGHGGQAQPMLLVPRRPVMPMVRVSLEVIGSEGVEPSDSRSPPAPPFPPSPVACLAACTVDECWPLPAALTA